MLIFIKEVFQKWGSGHGLCVMAFFCLLLTPGCGPKARVSSDQSSGTPRSRLPAAGYAIQMGAFSRVDNAVRLVETLESRGVYAYYFPHASGLFKVRCGDHATREEARKAAERLLHLGIIDEYYIVRPKDYAAVRARRYGDDSLRQEIVRTAESFIGVPYQWGGSSPEEGFDCSGLAMAVYQLNGLNLPRSSRKQFLAGNPIPMSDLSEGDLVFFSAAGNGRVSHVGIYRGDDQFIHAPGRGKSIRADSLSNRYYIRRFTGARSYIGN